MNTIGRIFRLTTWGESHGKAIGCVVDGCPSNLELNREDIQEELDRRRPGQSELTTSRQEEDQVEILSGVFEGRTLGSPISMLIWNKDVDSSKYLALKDTPRPGAADFTWKSKFGHVDWRGAGRASARETACRVAAGAVAKKLLKKFDIEVIAYTKEIAGIIAKEVDVSMKGIRDLIESNPVRCIDLEKSREMEEMILKAKNAGDSVGGIIEAVALNVPVGLGEPVYNKLSADLAFALMSIPAVKGVELGKGFEMSRMSGSKANDSFVLKVGKVKTLTNNSGGILGGISNGMPIVLRVAVKPTSSIGTRQKTVDIEKMKETTIKVEGRHDPCIVPRAVPVVEAMAAMVLADHGILSGLIPRKL